MKEFVEKLIGKLEEEAFAIQLNQGIKNPSTYDMFLETFTVRQIEEIVNQFAEEYKGGWIPCSERLPSVGVTVLCYWKKYDRYDNTTSYYYTLMHRNEDCQWLSDLGVCNGNVLAWQPLPQPYKEEGGENE